MGAALVASVLVHAGLLGSLGQLIGGVDFDPDFHPAARRAGGLRATLVMQPAESVSQAPQRADAAAPEHRASELAEARALFEGPKYFTAAELDQRPVPVSAIDLDPPAGVPARDGNVVARILISEHGRADKVQILAADPEGEFERIVIDAFAAAAYRPGVRNGRPVKSQLTVEIKFEPRDADGETAPEPPVRRAPPAQAR
jgi:hypothetical protein